MVDASSDEFEDQIVAVNEVLEQIGAQSLPQILVFNKCDLLSEERQAQLRTEYGALTVSANTGKGIDELIEHIAQMAAAQDEQVDVLIPYQRGDLVSKAHERCLIVNEEHTEDGTRISMMVPKAFASDFEAFRAE